MERAGGKMVRDVETSEKNFDVVIIGGGLAGMMHADLLADDPSPDMRVAIVDPHPDSLRDKTFAAWRIKSSLPHRYSACVENRWGKFRITSPDGHQVIRDFGKYCYERIPGSRLMMFIQDRITGDSRFQIIRDQVTSIVDVRDEIGQAAHITTAVGLKLRAKRAINSVSTGDPEVWQYFLGFELETAQDHFDADVVDLMDFRVEQDSDVRFVYTLPFSRRQALVEFTVFSPRRIPDAECEKILRAYIDQYLQLSNFSITKVESGAIPMTLRARPRFTPTGINSVLDVTGGAAGMVKPSTGYSFQRNFESVFESSSAQEHLTSRTSYLKYRFEVYDSLLLRIIQTNGNMISQIFPVLFSTNIPSKIFSFLDEKSSFLEEIKIFYRLPWTPFLTGLIVLYPFLFAASASILLYQTIGGASAWIIPVIGLLTAGIGHGSLDHLLDPQSRYPWQFYGRYLGSMAAFLLIWFVFPPLALGFFLFQSADHFGEANWIRSIENSGHAPRIRVLAWIWGLFAAIFGVLVHWSDASTIVQLILLDSISVAEVDHEMMRQAGFGLFVVASLASWQLDKYERKSLGRAVCGLPATVFLGVSILALPLLPGFFCFFAFWHGWDSIVAQRARMGWTSTEYATRAVRYTFVSLIGIFSLILAGAAWGDLDRIWQILFVMIGALTAAHAPVMTRFLKRKPPRFFSGAAT